MVFPGKPATTAKISSVVPAWFVPAAARMLQLAQQAAERINLVLVGELLPFGMFHQLQNLIHAPQRLFQGFDDGHDFVDGLADGRTGRWGVNRRLGGGRRGRDFFPDGRGGRLARRADGSRPARAASTAAAPSPPAAAFRSPGWLR